MSAEIHVGDVGTVFEPTIRDQASQIVDVSGATRRRLIFKAPDGTAIRRPAVNSSDGTDGKIRYVTQNGDLSQAGWWQVQAYVEFGGVHWHSTLFKFQVLSNAEDDPGAASESVSPSGSESPSASVSPS